MSQLLTQFFEMSTDLLCVANLDGFFETVNPRWTELFGYSSAELTSAPFLTFIHPDDVAATLEETSKLRDEAFATVLFENRYRTKDGDYKWLAWNATQRKGKIFGIARDVTDVKVREQALASRNAILSNYESALNNHSIIARTDPRGRITFVNDMFCKMSQYSREELLGQSHRIINSGYHPKEFFKDLWRTIAAGQPWRGEIKNRAKDGTFYWVDTTITPTTTKDGEISGYLSVRYDITSRKKAEEDIVKQREFYQSLFTNMMEGLVIHDQSGAIIQFNDAALDILALTYDQIQGRTSFDPTWRAVTEEGVDLPGERHPAIVSLRTGKRVSNFIMGVHRPDGQITWIQVNSFPIFEHDPKKAIRVVATFQDVTEQRHLLLRERQVSDRLREAQKIAKVGDWSLNVASGDCTWSAQMHQIFPHHYGAPAPTFERHLATIHPEDQDNWLTAIKTCMRDGKSMMVRFRTVHSDGRTVWVEARGRGELGEFGRVTRIFGTSQDITQQLALEMELRETQTLAQHNAKLASIGELAAGVGHEINNPLAIADGNILRLTKLLAELGVDNPNVARCLDNYKVASGRVAAIVQGLRTFARADSKTSELIDISAAVSQTLSLIKEIYRIDGIELTFETSPDIPSVVGNAGRLQQAIMNLLANAKDAVEGLPEKKIQVALSAVNGHVRIAVGDNGRGITDDLREKIFSPFFTTKEIGKGTGIGLSITSTIVKEHGGTLTFASSSLGTTFEILLPASSGSKSEVSTIKPMPSVTAKPVEQSDTLRALVVDDEAALREILSELLIDRKCRVVQAANGEEALALIAQGPFDLIVTDLKMPVMDGYALIRAATKANLRANSVLVALTGGTDGPESAPAFEELKTSVDTFLYKPFNHRQLDEIVELARSRRRKHAV